MVGIVTRAEFLFNCFLPFLSALSFESFKSLHDLRVRLRVVAIPSESNGSKGYGKNKEGSVRGGGRKQMRKVVGMKV